MKVYLVESGPAHENADEIYMHKTLKGANKKVKKNDKREPLETNIPIFGKQKINGCHVV